MKKIIFSLLAISSIFFISDRVYALTLSKPTGYTHLSNSSPGVNFSSDVFESSNAYGYPNWAMPFFRANYIYYDVYKNWYSFDFENLNNDCGNGPVVLKGTFLTWTDYNPGIFNNSPYINFINSQGKITNCSFISSYNSNVLNFQCVVENMTSIGSFNIGFQDPGIVSNGSESLSYYDSYVGISKNLDISCQISTSTVLDNQNQNTQNIINNQNQNNQNIINNNNQNTQDVINNQEQNKNDIIDNQNKNNEELKDTINDNFNNCRDSKNLFDISTSSKGTIGNDNGIIGGINDFSIFEKTENYIKFSATRVWRGLVSDFIQVQSGNYTLSFTSNYSNLVQNVFYYDENKNFINKFSMQSINEKIYLIPENAKYIRFYIEGNGSYVPNTEVTVSNIQFEKGSSKTNYEKYGEQICSNKIDETNQQLGDLNSNLTDSNIDTSGANGFFNNYQYDDYGLSSIITAPLELIKKLNNSQCTELSIPLPYVKNQNLKLPCMNTIYKQHFNSLFTLYQNITTGFIAYWVAIRIFALVKSFKDPEDDKIEVLDL